MTEDLTRSADLLENQEKLNTSQEVVEELVKALEDCLSDYKVAYDTQAVISAVTGKTNTERMAAGVRCDSFLMPRIVEIQEILSKAKTITAQPVSPWRPIETAPKDGTKFLACNNPKRNLNFKMHVAHWNAKENCFLASAPQVLRHLTHWIPLPAPPEKQDD